MSYLKNLLSQQSREKLIKFQKWQGRNKMKKLCIFPNFQRFALLRYLFENLKQYYCQQKEFGTRLGENNRRKKTFETVDRAREKHHQPKSEDVFGNELRQN